MYKVINSEGLVHNCHTKERYDNFKASGWKDYTDSNSKKPKTTTNNKGKV